MKSQKWPNLRDENVNLPYDQVLDFIKRFFLFKGLFVNPVKSPKVFFLTNVHKI
ncbi:hypothetical protein HanRHA438_Chr04g0151981 [Helianthus annuus]|nr:hypothetical protein HanRHA438_Chr04g0151981 [Helianthus annuus]